MLTSSPYKNELVAIKKEKGEKDKIKKMKLEIQKEKKQNRARGNQETERPTNGRKKGEAKRELKGKSKAKTCRKPLYNHDDEDSDDVSDADCFFCGDYFSKSRENEGWIQCSGCLNWAHEACAGAEKQDDAFICDLCK